MLKKNKLLLIGFFCLWTFCLAGEVPLKKAGDIKTASDNFMQKELEDFSSVVITKSIIAGRSSESIATFYQKNNTDGKSYMRTEMGSGKFRKITLVNKSGHWSINGNKANNNEFTRKLADMMQAFGTLSQANSDIAPDIEETSYGGIPCFVLKQAGPGSSKLMTYMRDILGKGLSSVNKNMLKSPEFTAIIPESFSYYIGKSNNFLYVTNSYNKNKELISSTRYTDVKFNTGLTEEFFDLPEGVTIEKVSATDAMLNELREAEKENEKLFGNYQRKKEK